MKMTVKNKAGLFVLIITAMAVGGCSGNGETSMEKEERATAVKAVQIVPTSKELKKIFTGTLEGERQAVIRAKIAEAVDKIYVPEGEDVKAGAAIIGLDKTGPTSNYIQSRSLYQNAEKNYNKMKYLFDEGAISESAYDAAETEYEVARANYDAARQLVELTTSISGTVTSIDVSVGDYVSSGQQVATVATIDILRMKLGINASDIGYFDVGDSVKVFVEASSKQIAGGKVVTVARSADPVTRTFQVEIEIDNAEHLFKPGMFGRSEVVIERFDEIVVVPRAAVITREDKNYVFTVTGDRARIRQVILGTEFNGTVHIKEGINPGDSIITVGQEFLDDGYKIKLSRFVDAEGKEIEL